MKRKTFLLFVYKQIKVLRFNWISVCIILSACYGLQHLLLYFMFHPIEELKVHYSPEVPETLNNGCFFDVEVGYSQTFYAPDTPEVLAFMEQICDRDLNIKSFTHPETMLKTIEECKDNCAGVYFELPLEGGGKSIKYTIYTNRMKLPTDQRYVTDSLDTSFSQSRDFIHFIKLQHSIDMNYITQETNIQPDVTINVGSMPYMRGGYFQNESGMTFGLLFPIFFTILLESTFLVPLVEEKQDGIKEFLVIATTLSYLNGVAFYVVRLIIYMLYAAAVLIVASHYNALGIIPGIYAFLLVFLFMLAIMSYTYLISVFFNSVFYAKHCGYFLMILPVGLAFINSGLKSVGIRIFSLNAFIEAWNNFQIFGNKYGSFEFSHLFDHITDSSFSIFQIYFILVMQCIIYSVLYLYLANIFPGPGGIKKPYLFFIEPDYWKKIVCNECVTNENVSDAIIIQDLEKRFKISGRDILIADRLNMVIKNKQITVLLGHNGAGKTTTINMIMGMVPQDKGKIIVCSEQDASCYRHLIGYCPQHSIYMQYMTCKQHLVFFAKLRGLSHHDANILANKLLQQLNLIEKANEYGVKLSGGMKRRLSLGIAIAGETKIVVLDEPSSGLDIESRRELWDILLELRKTKAILITTHHMEEADVLGDTISILSNGRLQLTGSPLELKHKVGSGYILKLCTNPSQFNEYECLELIREHIPSASIMNVVPPTVSISLPYEYKENYSKMLKNLERVQMQFGINTISITDTTLEDVFLNSVPKVEANDEIDGAVNCHGDTNIRIPYERLDSLKNIGLLQQFMAIAYKKSLFMRNEWVLAMLLISIPFFMTTNAIVTIHSSTVVKFGTGLQLSLNHYQSGIVYMNIPDEPTPNVLRFSQIVKQQIESYAGLKVKELLLNSSSDIEDELTEIMKNDFFNFQQNVLGTLQITGENRPSITILYSENMMHGSAILTNLVDNAIYMWTANTNERILNTIYAPVAVRDASAGSLKLAYYATFVPMGMFMLMFYFAMLPFKENRSGFKHLQAMSPYIYWGSVFICDLLLLLLICATLYLYQTIIMPRELYDLKDLSNIIIAIFFYGLNYLPLIYCFTNMFTTLSALSTCMVTLFYVSFIPPFILSTSIADMLKYENYILFLRLLPDFNLSHQLRVINERFVNNNADHIPENIRNELNSKRVLNLGNYYFYVFVVFHLLMFIFLYYVENKRHRCAIFGNSCKISKSKLQQCPVNNQEDRFIQEEKSIVDKIIQAKNENEYPLIVQNIHKQYGRKPAVNGLHFVVRKKECFGLLGVNGAGKTTTFEMIAAKKTISAGTIKIDGVDILQNESEYRYRFGYCPQNDCLNDFMSAYQTLRYMALLRGIQMKHVHEEVMYWLEKLDLAHYENVQVKHYSGGTKRKLQTAAAMIGSPSLVLLDEPTTGVDPISRRFLWQSIQDFQRRDKTLVLTSHSMDECEHLCNRLAIMAEGQFKCLGYVPELKQLYGNGFTISIKLKTNEASDDDVEHVTQQIQQQFTHCKLRENHAGILTYFIKSYDFIQWSEVFAKCELLLSSLLETVEEYSVNETTLEDIFLKYDTKNKRHSTTRSSSEEPLENGCGNSIQIEED